MTDILTEPELAAVVIRGVKYRREDLIQELQSLAEKFPDEQMTKRFFIDHSDTPESAWAKLFNTFAEFKWAAHIEHPSRPTTPEPESPRGEFYRRRQTDCEWVHKCAWLLRQRQPNREAINCLFVVRCAEMAVADAEAADLRIQGDELLPYWNQAALNLDRAIEAISAFACGSAHA